MEKDSFVMTNDQYTYIRESLARVEHLLELQNGRVRKNAEDIAILKSWRESRREAWDSLLQQNKGEHESVRSTIREVNETLKEDIEKLRTEFRLELVDIKKSLHSIQIGRAEDKSAIDFIKENWISIVIAVALLLQSLGISIPNFP